jgi:hypothetical protein
MEIQLQSTNVTSLHSQKDYSVWNSAGPAGTGLFVLTSLTERNTLNRISVAASNVSKMSAKNKRHYMSSKCSMVAHNEAGT